MADVTADKRISDSAKDGNKHKIKQKALISKTIIKSEILTVGFDE